MAHTKAQLRQQRVNQINKAYEKSHYAFYREYDKAHNEVLRMFGIPKGTAFHDLPVEVHEALAEHKHALVANLQLAHEAKLSSVSSLPRVRFASH